jgi:hypothetical protein
MVAAVSSVQAGSGAPQKSTKGAMLRSLVVPGWGQLYNRSYIKAIVFAGIEVTQMIIISQKHDEMMAAKRFDAHPEQFDEESEDWASATNDNHKASANARHARELRNKTIWWFAGALMLSIGDAYVDAHLYGLDFSPDLSFNDEMTVGVIASISF